MIVKPVLRSMSGFEIIPEAALKAGSRSFFAAPSPFQSLVLNAGAALYQAHHGSFIQAETPAAALAMALGAAAAESLPLVSANLQDFLQMQEVLSFCVEQRRALVLVILANGSALQPDQTLQFATLQSFFHHLPGLQIPLKTLLPDHLQTLWDQTLYACHHAREFRRPVVLLLDPLLLQQQGPIRPALLPRLPEIMAELEIRCDLPPDTASIWLAGGVLAHWLRELRYPRQGVISVRCVQPLPYEALQACQQQFPDACWRALEYEGQAWQRQLNLLMPNLKLASLSLRGAPEPTRLQQQIREALARV